MKLSEAIMLGSAIAPQGFGMLVDSQGNLCAFGAAARAVGSQCYSTLEAADLWPWVNLREWITCPVCPRVAACVSENIVHMNDEHRMSFEKIASWVASVEPKEEQADGGQGPVQVPLEVTAS